MRYAGVAGVFDCFVEYHTFFYQNEILKLSARTNENIYRPIRRGPMNDPK
jgi:hypothetical protein